MRATVMRIALAVVASTSVATSRAQAPVDPWSTVPVAGQPTTGYPVASAPAFTAVSLPVDALRGRWVRAYATLASPTRATLRVEVAYGSRRSFSPPPRCETAEHRARCVATMWIPFEAERARLVQSGPLDPALRIQAAAGGGSVRDRAQPIVDLLRAGYYRRGEVDWTALEARVAAIPMPPDVDDAAPGVAEYLRSQMPGNEHLVIVRRAGMSAPPSAETAMPTCGAEDAAGVVALPSLQQTAGEVPTRYAGALHDCLVASDARRPWIVDLRGNGGGNMYPMIAGLAPLLPVGPLYAFTDGQRTARVLVALDERSVTNGGQAVMPQHDAGTRTTAPVIVVVGPHCSSSCEQTANALAARPRTLFVGEPTAGYLTVNSPAAIDDDYAFTLTNGYTEDPCGKVIEHNLRPDVTVEAVDRRSLADIVATPAVQTWLVARAADPNPPDDARTVRCASPR